jgi:excisionase family DNA binding protein
MAKTDALNGKEPYFFTAKEAAHFLRIEVGTLYDWMHQKGGPPYKRTNRGRGGRYRLPRQQLIDWANKTQNRET